MTQADSTVIYDQLVIAIPTLREEGNLDRLKKFSTVLALEIAKTKHWLIADLHNGFQISVEGHPKSIDALKDSLIPNRDVKSIRVFDQAKGEYTTKLNYTQLTELRK